MRVSRPIVLLLLLALIPALLSACDFGAATPTPIPPTPTPSPTPVPPTATTAASEQGTPGAASALATAAVEGTPAVESDLQLIAEAITTTRGLDSYHVKADIGGMGQSTVAEGDFQAPDRLSLDVDLDATRQIVIIGSDVYSRDAEGNWSTAEPEEQQGGPAPFSVFGFGASADLFGMVAPFISGATSATSLGTETMHDTSVRHMRVPIFAGSLMGLGGSTTPGEMPVGYADLWIDPATKYIHRLAADVDLTDLMQAFSGFAPTPAPGEPTPTPMPEFKFQISIEMSAHNEPVNIETPPLEATATP